MPCFGGVRDRVFESLVMPAKKGFCWCLGGTAAPPEISYGLENGGMTLKPIEVDVPMPADEAELNAKFAELVDELGLDKPHRDAMFDLPPEKKWQIYCSKKREQDDPSSASWPDFYIERVNQMKHIFFSHDEEEIENRTKLVDSLKTALRTQPMSFVLRFLEMDGLECLLNFLTTMDYTTAQSPVHTSVIGCLKALLNNPQGRANVLAHPRCINVIASSLSVETLRTKVAVLEILAALCLVPGGHKKVLAAFYHFQKVAAERTRFQTLMLELDRSTGEYRDEVALKTAIMSFINAALKYGPGQTHLEFRLHLRYEFLMLGIIPIIEKLRTHDNATLDRHLDFFEMIRNEDEKKLAQRFESSHIDTKSASSMFELLKKKLNFSVSYNHLQSILFHLLQLPLSTQSAGTWQVLDRIVQQITLQTRDGDPDADPLEIDVKKIVKQLANENQLKEIQTKMREIQKENDELASKLAKKEHEIEVKMEEKEELMTTLNKMKTKMEKEAANHKQRLAELEQQVADLSTLVDLERMERAKLEHAVHTGSLPDDAKVGLSSAALLAASTKLSAAAATTTMAAVPPPPPPPPGGGPPAPPPPPPGIGGSPAPPPVGPPPPGFGIAIRKKDIPKPNQPLKSFNWAKVPENQIKGTIWTDVDESRVYKTLDLGDFEKNFSAYQGKEGSDSDLSSKSMSPNAKAKELSVIDGRRAQNCTILLSKLKMTNKELATAVWNVDPREEIPKDMCEQLLKFVPTPEEAQLLAEHEHEIEQMAKADRFLFEMSTISHYEQRLQALYYKKKFSERMHDSKPKVEAVLEASKQLYKSRRLRRLLELVLAFGNFMNRGQRGNAAGFRLNSLNKIGDTRSSINRKMTLLHYLLQVIEQKFPELLKLEQEIPQVRKAAKVNMTELEADIRTLKAGLKDIEKEISYQKKQSTGDAKDKFVSVMSDFVSIATYNFSELEEQVLEMREKYEKTVRLFSEDPKACQPDEFFAILETFLTAFSDAQLDNDRFRREKELEAKRFKIEQQVKAEKEKRATRLNINGKARNGSVNGSKDDDDKGEFDDLISALRTGDVFGEEMVKLKRSRKRVSVTSSKSNGGVAKTTEVSRERVGLTRSNRAS